MSWIGGLAPYVIMSYVVIFKHEYIHMRKLLNPFPTSHAEQGHPRPREHFRASAESILSTCSMLFPAVTHSRQPYPAHCEGFFLSSANDTSYFVAVPVDVGLEYFLTVDDLNPSIYVNPVGVSVRARPSDVFRAYVAMDDVPGVSPTSWDLYFYYQDQSLMKGVARTPTLQHGLPGIQWRGDILAVAVAKDGMNTVDVSEPDKPNIQTALIWRVISKLNITCPDSDPGPFQPAYSRLCPKSNTKCCARDGFM